MQNHPPKPLGEGYLSGFGKVGGYLFGFKGWGLISPLPIGIGVCKLLPLVIYVRAKEFSVQGGRLKHYLSTLLWSATPSVLKYMSFKQTN